jgi:hypothetical protein
MTRTPATTVRTGFLHALAAVLIGLGTFAAAEAGAEGGFADIVEVCHAASVPRGNGPIREITVRLAPWEQSGADPDNGNEGRSYLLSVAFTEWDAPNLGFDTQALCYSERDGILNCSIDCDGGRAALTRSADGRLFMETQSLVYGARGHASLMAVSDADGGQLSGLFALEPKPGDEMCRPGIDRRFVALEPGDISPRVRAAETMLNRLGQLLESPDAVFDEATSNAVSTFQIQYGLEPSGRIDERTARLLSRMSAMSGGC